MNQNAYREAVEKLRFSEDFQERTIKLLQAARTAKRGRAFKWKRPILKLALAAGFVIVLSISGYAVSRLLSPAQAAQEMSYTIAKLGFESDSAIPINETQQMGEYQVTLTAMVTEESTADPKTDLDLGSTYIAFAVRKNDGSPIDIMKEFGVSYTITPLLSGCDPADSRGLWNYSSCGLATVIDGTYYHIFRAPNLELFADHTVYLAFYQNTEDIDTDNDIYYFPEDVFTMSEGGSISYREDFPLPHALFTLPLDKSKADPEAAEKAYQIIRDWNERSDKWN